MGSKLGLFSLLLERDQGRCLHRQPQVPTRTPCFPEYGRCDGERRRKSLRGCIVSQDLSVINLVIVKEFAGSFRAEVIDEEVAVVETDTMEKCGPGLGALTTLGAGGAGSELRRNRRHCQGDETMLPGRSLEVPRAWRCWLWCWALPAVRRSARWVLGVRGRQRVTGWGPSWCCSLGPMASLREVQLPATRTQPDGFRRRAQMDWLDARGDGFDSAVLRRTLDGFGSWLDPAGGGGAGSGVGGGG